MHEWVALLLIPVHASLAARSHRHRRQLARRGLRAVRAEAPHGLIVRRQAWAHASSFCQRRLPLRLCAVVGRRQWPVLLAYFIHLVDNCLMEYFALEFHLLKNKRSYGQWLTKKSESLLVLNFIWYALTYFHMQRHFKFKTKKLTRFD